MTNQLNAATESSIQDTSRKPYSAPQLTTFGAVRDLTAGGSAHMPETGRPGGKLGRRS